jgi:hypothetical protein
MVVRPFGRESSASRLSQIIPILHLRIVEPRPSPSECETISFLGGPGGRERSVAGLDGPPGQRRIRSADASADAERNDDYDRIRKDLKINLAQYSRRKL